MSASCTVKLLVIMTNYTGLRTFTQVRYLRLFTLFTQLLVTFTWNCDIFIWYYAVLYHLSGQRWTQCLKLAVHWGTTLKCFCEKKKAQHNILEHFEILEFYFWLIFLSQWSKNFLHHWRQELYTSSLSTHFMKIKLMTFNSHQ